MRLRIEWWVSLPYATYSVTTEGSKVVDAAPIAKWMVGKDWGYCRGWLNNKGAVIVQLFV